MARGTDRFEDLAAWVLATCAAGVVLLGVAVGRLGAQHTLDRSRAEAAVRVPELAHRTSAGTATVVGWTWGVAVVLAGWAVLALLWAAVRAATARRNAAAWAREWALVEPTWSGRAPR
jgi:hypothetical protein